MIDALKCARYEIMSTHEMGKSDSNTKVVKVTKFLVGFEKPAESIYNVFVDGDYIAQVKKSQLRSLVKAANKAMVE
jgi:hypothetical protein